MNNSRNVGLDTQSVLALGGAGQISVHSQVNCLTAVSGTFL
jgi:hypothetical protein